jgi:hypothetical protein
MAVFAVSTVNDSDQVVLTPRVHHCQQRVLAEDFLILAQNPLCLNGSDLTLRLG